MDNRFRKALLERKLTCGAWIQIGHPAIAEIFARCGFDWVCVDLEHGVIDLETMANLFRAIERFDSVPVARLPFNDPIWIHRALDAGAKGLIVPMVNSGQEAENAVRQAKYPPRGTRGFGYSRANLYGIEFERYIHTANKEIALVIQIEHKEAIANLQDILAVAGVDGVFIGPLDLSGSMGITGQLQHPQMIKALEQYRTLCLQADKSFGLHIIRPNPENIQQAIEQGYTMLALGLDGVFLAEAGTGYLSIARQGPQNERQQKP